MRKKVKGKELSVAEALFAIACELGESNKLAKGTMAERKIASEVLLMQHALLADELALRPAGRSHHRPAKEIFGQGRGYG